MNHEATSRRAALGAMALLAMVLMTAEGLASRPASTSLAAAENPSCNRTVSSLAQPVGTGPCPGVRPGAMILSDEGSCTMNFLFKGNDGRRYIGTAGHCILAGNGEAVYKGRTGPEARDADGNRIGRFAYAVLKAPKDFALVRLDKGVKSDAQMCHFGGPTEINDDITTDTVVLEFFGNGLGIGSIPVANVPTLPARSAVANGMPDPDHVSALGAAAPGDSGSGINSEDGRAVGVVVTIGSNGIGITRIAPQLARAEKQLRVDLKLLTAPPT